MSLFKLTELWPVIDSGRPGPYTIYYGSPGLMGGGGVLGTKVYGDVPVKWVSKSASWYNDHDPLFSANWYKHGSYFENFLKLARK